MKKIAVAIGLLVLLGIGALLFNNYSKTFYVGKFTNNLSHYEKVKDILIVFKDSIRKKLIAHEPEAIHSDDIPTVFYGNKSYYCNWILNDDPVIPELKEVLALWDDNLMQDDDLGGGDIWLDRDNTVGFMVRIRYGWFVMPTIMHYIVFDPTHKFIKDKNNYPFEVIKQKALGKDWIYVIVKRYFDD